MTHFLFAALVIGLTAIVFAGTELLHRRGAKHKYFMRPIGLVMAAVALVAYLWREPAVYRVQGLDMYSPFGGDMTTTTIAILLFWLTSTAMLINVFAVFFEYRTLRHMARYFSPLVVLIDLVALPTYLAAFTGVTGYTTLGGVVGATPFSAPDVRYGLLIIQMALTLAISLFLILREKELLPTKREWLTLLYALPLVALITMPAFVPQALIGFNVLGNAQVYGFAAAHRLALYGALILPYVLYLFVRRKDEETRRFLMIFLSIAMLWVYIGQWTLPELRSPWNWPLHLCNAAMFLIPLCLIFRTQRLFNFCLIISVTASALAMLMASDLGGVHTLATERVSYWINHYAAFAMPVLFLALKLFRRPKLKDWTWVLIGFSAYFVLVLFCNAFFTSYRQTVLGDAAATTDFFFLNSGFVSSKLGGAVESLRTNHVATLVWSPKWLDQTLTLTFYPLYQFLFYVVYVGVFAVGVRFIYEILFRSWDKADNRREREHAYKMMKKDLHNFLGGKPITEPISGDASPRIELKHFHKKYGANKHYSVRDVSFEVHGGEIFGFLGPNGAGKSTIIKSIVGMQTITEGTIEVCGFDVDRQAVQAKMEVGFVPDHYALYENLTGREYINYIADLYRVSKEDRDAFMEKYVARFQLTHSFDNQMKTYSHGMKQKITIMAALVHNPKVWILDEPLTGLDPTSIYEVKECMKEHAAAGNIVFFSSHIIDVVENICHRIAIIKGGQLRAYTSIADLKAEGKELEQFYLDIIYSDNGDLSATEHAKGEVTA